jgi:hypothetical protein
MTRSSNALHYIALAMAAMNMLQFLIFNDQGILDWSGIGVYVTIPYVIFFVLNAIVWFVAQLRSRSTLAAIFWIVMLFPIVFIVLLPEKFSA